MAGLVQRVRDLTAETVDWVRARMARPAPGGLPRGADGRPRDLVRPAPVVAYFADGTSSDDEPEARR